MRAYRTHVHHQPQITFARIARAATLVAAFVYTVHLLYN